MDSQMKLINQIAATTSRKNKEFLLTKVDKKILLYAYHPDKRYYFTSKLDTRILTGKCQLTEQTWRVLDILASGQCRGHKAAILYNNYIESLTPASAELFNRILHKDLKCGVSIKTINKIYPSLVPMEFCMLCTDYVPDKMYFPCYASIKIDGDRAIFYPNRGFISRTGKKITGLDHLIGPLQHKGQVVDGELRDTTLSNSKSSGVIRSDAKTKPNVRFFVFDSKITSSMPFNERLAYTRKHYHRIHSHIIVLPHFRCLNDVQLRSYYKVAVKKGHEGLVVKNYSHMYQFKRTSDWMRMVPVKTADVKVLKLVPGKKGTKYETIVGALEVEFNGHIQKVGSGLSDEQRLYFCQEPSAIVDRTIEVEYKELTDHGKMRQPRFKRIRYDK